MKAIFYCDFDECKDHEQLFFCYECIADEKHVHGNGKPKLKINDEFNKRKQEWEGLKMKFKDL